MTFDAHLLFFGTELIKARQEQERRALMAQNAEKNGQAVGEGSDPAPAQDTAGSPAPGDR
jgi:hypothetical protein